MEPIKKVLEGVFKELRSPKKNIRQKLLEKWPVIVGEKIAAHTKPQLSNDGKLTVWVDQSALAFELKQRYQQGLLKRAQAVLGEEAVKSVRFYVGQIR